MDKIRVIQTANNLAEKFKPHAYPFAGGSGFMTGETDEESQYQNACLIAALHAELTHQYLIEDDGFPMEIQFWKDVENELKLMSKRPKVKE
jgi:hypothetical protein